MRYIKENLMYSFLQTFEKIGNVCIESQHSKNFLHNFDLLVKC